MKTGSFLPTKALKSEKIRFGLVGIANTGVDFVILFILARVIGVPVVIANMISTLCAVAVSYFLNKKAVFKNVDQQGPKLLIAFIIVTLVGLWVLQSIIIISVAAIFANVASEGIVLLAAKVIATVASLIWNYLWYSRVIFRKKHEKKI